MTSITPTEAEFSGAYLRSGALPPHWRQRAIFAARYALHFAACIGLGVALGITITISV